MSKLRQKTMATLLIAVFLLSSIAFAANAAIGVTFNHAGDGSAGWYTGGNSIALDDGSEEAVSFGSFYLTIDPVLLANLMEDPSYLVLETAVVSGYHPYVNIFIDFDGIDLGGGDYIEDWDALEGVLGTTLDGGDPIVDSWTEMASLLYYDQDSSMELGHDQNSPVSLATWQAESSLADAVVYKIEIRYGMDLASNMDTSQAVRVDDITVGGKTYLLVDSGVTVFTDVVAPIIGITVSRNSIDFGSLFPGETSAPSAEREVTITNVGDVTVTVSAILIEEDPTGFYTANLDIDSVDFTAWMGITLPKGDTSDLIPLSLTIPNPCALGPKTAKLVFEATPEPPTIP